ncbi:hypothetical protein GCM10023219_11360 [Stakelama sediminis]|uniref:PilZ domain-containing protein n=1 Tax=Stakelama sediminis TaxID=463200 RepID=A0A840YWC5_9SPHN|nr:hypothetical protein [Stakelama sediminis]MBB5717860.1 hypothetical protein [Stakelama sediminis]
MFSAELRVKPGSNRNGAVHIRTSATGTIAGQGAARCVCRVVDICKGGVQLTLYGEVDRDSPLQVMLPGVRGRKARVVWSQGFEISCLFDTPLRQKELDRLAEQQGFTLPMRKVSRLRAQISSLADNPI